MRRLILALAVVALVLLLPMLFFVWPPDVITRQEVILGRAKSKEGYQFEVNQYWNGVDFYTTSFEVRPPNKSYGLTYTLDGDDHKRWRCGLQIDETHKTVTVTVLLGLGVFGSFDWENEVFKRSDGDVVEPLKWSRDAQSNNK